MGNDPASTQDNIRTKPPATVTNCRSRSEDFVRALYRDVLERTPDASGLAFWTQRLDAGTTRPQVAESFLESVEDLGVEIDQFYTSFFRRSADAGGRLFWVNRLAAGVSTTDVATAFLTSGEYTSAHTGAASFVNGLFMDVLGRSGGVQLAAREQLLQDRILTRTHA